MNYVINILAFAVLCLLWAGFGYGIVFNRALLNTVWASFRALPVILQILVGIIILPVALALWIWESPWPLWIRLLMVIGLAFASIYMFLPKPPSS